MLDADVIARLERMGDVAGEDLIGQLAVLFLADAGIQVDAMRQALADGDDAAVLRTAHSMKGASANLGATTLARLFAAFPSAGAGGGEALLASVEAELGRVRSALGSLTVTQ